LKTVRKNHGLFSGTVEEATLRLGLAVLIAWLVLCAALARYAPAYCEGMLLSVAYHSFGGRAAGISAGLASRLPNWLVVAQAFATAMVSSFLVYPLVVYIYERGARKWLGRPAVRSTIEAAERGRARIGRWGLLGIAVFVTLPFYMTGPIVGALIGYFLGYAAFATWSAVAAGTLSAVIVWTFFFEWLQNLIEEMAEGFSAYVPLGILVIVLAGLVAARLRAHLRRRSRERARREVEEPAETPPPEKDAGAG
jgi:uncharacterized membrane protein